MVPSGAMAGEDLMLKFPVEKVHLGVPGGPAAAGTARARQTAAAVKTCRSLALRMALSFKLK